MSLIPRLRRGARHVVIAGVSLLALTSALLFLVAPSSTALSLESKAAGRTASNVAVVYGKLVNASGKPVKNAKITLSVKKAGHRKTVAKFTTNSKGVYRKVLQKPKKATYLMSVSAKVAGKVYRASKSIAIKPGKSYRLDGRLVKRNLFNFLPISTY